MHSLMRIFQTISRDDMREYGEHGTEYEPIVLKHLQLATLRFYLLHYRLSLLALVVD